MGYKQGSPALKSDTLCIQPFALTSSVKLHLFLMQGINRSHFTCWDHLQLQCETDVSSEIRLYHAVFPTATTFYIFSLTQWRLATQILIELKLHLVHWDRERWSWWAGGLEWGCFCSMCVTEKEKTTEFFLSFLYVAVTLEDEKKQPWPTTHVAVLVRCLCRATTSYCVA